MYLMQKALSTNGPNQKYHFYIINSKLLNILSSLITDIINFEHFEN